MDLPKTVFKWLKNAIECKLINILPLPVNIMNLSKIMQESMFNHGHNILDYLQVVFYMNKKSKLSEDTSIGRLEKVRNIHHAIAEVMNPLKNWTSWDSLV